MKNSTKLEKVKKFLEENNIAYKCRRRHRNGHCDLFVIDTKVSVKLEGHDDDIFFRRHKRGYHPFVKLTHLNLFLRKSRTQYAIR